MGLRVLMDAINRNMRCIEMFLRGDGTWAKPEINRNMRCIEIPIKAKQGKTFGD